MPRFCCGRCGDDEPEAVAPKTAETKQPPSPIKIPAVEPTPQPSGVLPSAAVVPAPAPAPAEPSPRPVEAAPATMAPVPASTIKVVGVCGSLRKASNNMGLLKAALKLIPEGATFEIADISELPVYNNDLEAMGTIPDAAKAYIELMKSADAFVFATPEHNYSMSAAMKNAVDWASRPNCFAGKAGAIMSAGGGFGGGRAQYHLRQVGVFLDIHFINKPEVTVSLRAQPQPFDKEQNLVDEAKLEMIKTAMENLVALAGKLKA